MLLCKQVVACTLCVCERERLCVSVCFFFLGGGGGGGVGCLLCGGGVGVRESVGGSVCFFFLACGAWARVK